MTIKTIRSIATVARKVLSHCVLIINCNSACFFFYLENDKYDSSYYNAGNNDMTEIQRQFQLLLSNYQNSLRASGFSGPDSLNSSRSVNRFRDFRDYGFQDNGQPINAYNSNKLKRESLPIIVYFCSHREMIIALKSVLIFI